MRPAALGAALVIASALTAAAQPPVARPSPPPAAVVQSAPQRVAPPVRTGTAEPGGERAPTEEFLNAPIYPTADFLGSYDAGGSGQRFYLFGTTQTFAAIVSYYQAVLKQRGELVFDDPAVHMFEVGRFREEDVAFPPGVTVKNYAWGGVPGYLNPKAGVTPLSYPTVIQIVPPPGVVPGKPKR
ncbi:MAG: hypothetical protein AB1806_21235 [Acidobacteriota bacterium]